MVIVRDTFQAKYGKSGDLVALFKEARDSWPGPYSSRILTDASGQFFTVSVETEVASLAEWEELIASIFSAPDFGAWFEQMTALVDSGKREYLNVE